ncbi:MAG: Ppx/GppA family phosphatase [Pseudoclavibacter caeni]|jgi:exopolyphosphatase / guanosine-5'-triphosphate,3'-diphosphate pyrophosphatase
MRLGVLDVGSNTVHMVVVDAHPGANPAPYSLHKSVLRLMRHLQPDGSISPEGVTRLVTAIGDAVEAARAEHVDDLVGIATSAVREATNGPEVLDLIEQRTGMHLRVLDGEDEARLTFLAVRRWFGWSSGRILLIDIGGGSLELAMGPSEYPIVSRSVPLGAGRTTVAYLHDDPPTKAQVRRLRRHAYEVVSDVSDAFAGMPRPDHVIGSSKTIRSLARLAGDEVTIGGRTTQWLRRADLKRWLPRLAALPAERRTELRGVTAERAFQIVGGGIVLHQTMKALDIDELEVSPWALREGVILRYLDSMETGADL